MAGHDKRNMLNFAQPHQQPKLSPPVVVFGLSATGLSIIRALAPYCEHIVAIEAERTDPCAKTRLCRVHWVDRMSDSPAVLASLRELALSLRRVSPQKPALLFSSDESVMFASRHTAELSELFSFLIPSPETCEALMFKDRFNELALQFGYPVPRGGHFETDRLVETVPAALSFPIIVKPTVVFGEWSAAGLQKAYILRSVDELTRIAPTLRAAIRKVIVQEYIDGDDDSVVFTLAFSTSPEAAPVLYSGRKLLQYPRRRGSTAICRPEPHPQLEALAERVMREQKLVGLFSIEAKEAPDGTLRIIEPTIGRSDLQSHVATLNGVNMPLCAYLHLTQQQGKIEWLDPTARKDVIWVSELQLWRLLRHGEFPWRVLLSLRRSPKGFAFWTWRDPWVSVKIAALIAGRALRRSTGTASDG
jgi:predicted ATP-grasp superfamily ATP-dependent carboligase